MGRRGVLLHREGGGDPCGGRVGRGHGPHPGYEGVPKDLNVALGPQTETSLKPNWGGHFTSGCNHPQEHGAGRVLGPRDVAAADDVVVVVLGAVVVVFVVLFGYPYPAVVLRVKNRVDDERFFV